MKTSWNLDRATIIAHMNPQEGIYFCSYTMDPLETPWRVLQAIRQGQEGQRVGRHAKERRDLHVDLQQRTKERHWSNKRDAVTRWICTNTPSHVYIYIIIYCMYVCMSVCLYVCMSVCLYVCMHACMHACMYRCIDVSCTRLMNNQCEQLTNGKQMHDSRYPASNIASKRMFISPRTGMIVPCSCPTSYHCTPAGMKNCAWGYWLSFSRPLQLASSKLLSPKPVAGCRKKPAAGGATRSSKTTGWVQN